MKEAKISSKLNTSIYHNENGALCHELVQKKGNKSNLKIKKERIKTTAQKNNTKQ